MKQRGFTELVVLLVLVIAVVAAGAYYFGKTSGQPKPTPLSASSPTSQISPTPSNVQDETANWKTYTNTFHKYVVKYPQDWYFSKPSCEDNCAPTIADTDLSLLENVPEPNDKAHIRLGILVLAQDSDSLRQWRNTTVINEEPVTLAGISGMKRTELRNDFFQLAEEVRLENIYINYKGKTYSLYYFPPDSKLKPILDQILSTFRFLP